MPILLTVCHIHVHLLSGHTLALTKEMIRSDKGQYIYLLNPNQVPGKRACATNQLKNSPTVGDFYSQLLMEKKCLICHHPIPQNSLILNLVDEFFI